MTQDAVKRLLARTRILADLSPEEIDRVARESRVRRYQAGEQVFAAGAPGGEIYVVAEGSIALTVTSSAGAEVVLAVMETPRSFGELSAIDGQPRVANAVVRRPSVLVSIPRQAVVRLMRDHSSVASALLVEMAAMIRQVDGRATDLVLKDLRGRVEQFLREAAAGTPAGPGGYVPVDVRLTQTELAQLVGGSRQHVNRIIVALEAEGAVQRKGSRIVGVRPDLLPDDI